MKFVVEVEPLPQPRPRFSFGRCYEPARVTQYKRQVTKAAKLAMAGIEPITGAVKMSITLYRKYKTTSRRFGDFDNHAKAICDACNGICFVDDSQVVSCVVSKHSDKDKPRVEVEITEHTGEESFTF